ncbi:phosphate acyltransferase PlsX [Salicola sp. Rm-C-2C1-2]|uniref:phosphate acyltransferase PlsX n=1 Tax=Salicola sp. Rm-C-2C1-2 TaxID=3141321 RepID=UPI0032E50690
MAAVTTIAVDAMSGDRGCEPVVRAAEVAVSNNRALRVVLLGRRTALEAFLSAGHERIEIHDAPDVVTMEDRPSHALRYRQQSSMAQALSLVRSGDADACVSAGNTGALMALGRSTLETWPGIERPAIIKRIPFHDEHCCYVLDLGANVDTSSEHLVQFALIGRLMAQAVDGIWNPRVALLNVGQEAVKGNEQVRLAGHMLQVREESGYIGYIEGSDLFRGVADVVVCDGFVGNVALKTGEGVAELIGDLIRRTFRYGWYSRLVALLAAPVLRRIKRRLDPARHNGASFIGLRGVVIKSHGNADVTGLVAAIEQAARETEHELPRRLGELLEQVEF